MDNLIIPRHVAIILDGNGRWAKSKGMPRNYGHVRGAKNLERICEDAWDIGIKYLTVYLFSTENWRRSRDEVDALMALFRSYTKTCIRTAMDNNMKVRVIGDPSAFADDLQESLKVLEETSKNNSELRKPRRDHPRRQEYRAGVRRREPERFGHYGRSHIRSSGYPGNTRPGSPHPYKRRAETFQLSAVAACVHGVLFYRGSVACLRQAGTAQGY